MAGLTRAALGPVGVGSNFSRNWIGDVSPPSLFFASPFLSDRFSVLRLANSIPLGRADGRAACPDPVAEAAAGVDVDASLAERYWARLSVWHSAGPNEGRGGLSGLAAVVFVLWLERLSLLSKTCRTAAIGLAMFCWWWLFVW